MRLAVVAAIVGALSGWWVTQVHYKGVLSETLLREQRAEDERVKALQRLSKEYYGLYKDLMDKPPTVVTDRVYVHAKCPVRPSESPGVDESEAYERVELDPKSVGRVTGVTDWGERKFQECSLQLNAILDYHEGVK